MADRLDVPGLVKNIQGTSLGKQLFDVFTATNSMPTINQGAVLDPGTLGEYTKSKNSIDLDVSLEWEPKARNVALAHELAHAALTQMSNTIHNNPNYPKDVAAQIDKLNGNPEDSAVIGIKKLIAKATGNDTYRQSWDERNAFGVGNIIIGR
jgi:hypothetical protein